MVSPGFPKIKVANVVIFKALRLSKDFKLRLDNQTGWGQSFRIDDDEAQKMLEVLASDPLRYFE